MVRILNIETSSDNCSVSLAIDGNVSSSKESSEHNSHSRLLTVLIDELLRSETLKMTDLDAVAISSGPGSYTGLRIGVSTAKGICYSLNKPLIPVDTLSATAYGILGKFRQQSGISHLDNFYICPLIDARRMEVYTAVFDKDLNAEENTHPKIIDQESFLSYLMKGKVIFGGTGAKKSKEIISSLNAVFLDGIIPSAENMCTLSYRSFLRNDFADVAYFEPFYLKEFIAGKPRNLL